MDGTGLGFTYVYGSGFGSEGVSGVSVRLPCEGSTECTHKVLSLRLSNPETVGGRPLSVFKFAGPAAG